MAKPSNKTCSKPSSKGGSKPRKTGYKPPYRKTGKGGKMDRETEEIADTAAKMSRSNPIELYTKYADFAYDAARVSFTRPLGNTYSQTYVDPQGNAATFKTADPGIMRIVFSPAIGVSSNLESPINRSSINFYGRLRATQKAFGDYDHQDLTMMMLSIDSCIMFHALARKIYGMLTNMSPVNKYYPQAIVNACGVSFNATQKQIQDFRAFINEYALQIEQYALPDNIELFNRHQWMCEGIYMDGTAKRAQSYMFVPAGFWQYTNTGETGSQLEWVPYINPGETAATSYTIEEFEQIGLNLIKAISNDADFATMSGDLYAYYGGSVKKLPYVEEKYQILPTYDETVLAQIENARIMGWFGTNYTPVISQNPSVNNGAIIYQPVVNPQGGIIQDTQMNYHVETPDEKLVIEATRLMARFGDTVGNDGNRYVEQCGTEIVHAVDIFVMNPATGAVRSRRLQQPTYGYSAGNGQEGTETTPAEIKNLLGDLIYLSKFDWAPKVDVIVYGVNGLTYEYVGNTWDIETVDFISESKLNTITTACLYSLFNVETR